MKNLADKILTLAEFIIGFCLGYIAFFFPIHNTILTLILVITSLYVLSQALDNIDKLNGYGKHNKNKDNI